MKSKLPLLFAILLSSLTAPAQWSPKANYPGIAKAKSTAFTIGSKIYVVGGVNSSGATLNDFWEYDISSNTWTQQPNFPGPERYGAVSFVLNNKGYVATGGNDFGYLDDLWQYDPLTATWIQKTGLPAGSAQHENQRREAYSFVIGNKAYLGGGDGFVFGPNSTSNIAFYDLWEYNPFTDSWTQKSDIPDFIGRDMSIAVALNNKGYVGLGCNVQQTINRQSFWEYSPVSDTWTAKANFPSNFTVDAGAFALDSNLYLVGGVNLNPVSLSNQFYKYNPITDSWTLLANFNGGAIAGEFSVSTGTSAFVGTGYNSGIVPRNDLWELTTITGITETIQKAENVITIYPNPSSSITSVMTSKEVSSIDLYDAKGIIVLNQESGFENINVGKLNPGIYHMKITFKDGNLLFKRFIKIN
jgi:N-acetylneuraminic acid mutarotase